MTLSILLPTRNCTGYSWCYIPTNPPTSTITTTTTVVAVCGIDTGYACANGSEVEGYTETGKGLGVPLAPYKNWAKAQGYDFWAYDTDTYGTKASLSNQLVKDMNAHPEYNYILVGHSAGADAIALAVNNTDLTAKKILGIVFLDPSVTARIKGKDQPITNDFNDIASMGIKVYIADSDKDNIDLGIIPGFTAPFVPFDVPSHTALADSTDVFSKAIEYLFEN